MCRKNLYLMCTRNSIPTNTNYSLSHMPISQMHTIYFIPSLICRIISFMVASVSTLESFACVTVQCKHHRHQHCTQSKQASWKKAAQTIPKMNRQQVHRSRATIQTSELAILLAKSSATEFHTDDVYSVCRDRFV